jgi:hypothetical protein
MGTTNLSPTSRRARPVRETMARMAADIHRLAERQ